MPLPSRTFLLAAIFIARAVAQRTPFRPGDLQAWRTASEIRIEPDGGSVVYADSGRKAPGDTESNLWLGAADGRTRRQITQGGWRDWSPRWASDPRAGDQQLAYLTNRSGRTQIRVWRLASGSDSEVGGVSESPIAIAFSPRGDAVAFTASARSKQSAATWAPPSILDFLRPAFPPHAQLFLVSTRGGPARRLTQGDLDWIGEPAWMPDGQTILCAAAGGPDAEHPMQRGAIFGVRVADGAMTQLTEPDGDDSDPTPSPDGSRIAWLSTAGRPQSYNLRHLYAMNRDGSRVKELSGSFDRDVSQPQWSSDSRTVYFIAEDSGAAHVYAARNDGSVRPVTRGPERLRDFSLADNGRAAAMRSSEHEAGDVISFAIDLPGGATTIYAPNEHLLAEREIGAMEEMHYQSDGRSIQAWLVMPPGFDAAKRYPLLLDLRDSPRAMYGYEFQLRAQMFAAAGFVVLLANPRGAPGYGEEFGNLLATRNPGDDAADLLRGVDAAVGKGFIDPKRITISGALAAAWILTRSDRFTAAVLRDPIADRTAEIALASDPLRRAFSELGALPWSDPAQYWQHSPIYFAGGLKTPTLIVTRAGDVQAREIRLAFEARKVDSALIDLPAPEDAHEIAALEAEIGWLKR
jgi:acylaminoacyl-peptidase